MFLGPKRTYEEFKRQLGSQILDTFDELRRFCLSLGDNVVEDVRAHRVVFGKSISFRWFADMEPDNDTIIIKIQKDRREPFATLTVSKDQDLDQVKLQLRSAYDTIR